MFFTVPGSPPMFDVPLAGPTTNRAQTYHYPSTFA